MTSSPLLPALILAAALCLGPVSSAQAPETMEPASGSRAEVWIGGSRAWPDFVAPGKKKQWTFLQQNADGFYINNFALRLTDKSLKLAPTQQGRLEELRAMRGLMKSPKAFYETDQENANDTFDQAAVKMFAPAGFRLSGVTINRGTNPARTRILTDSGRLPLYYMFGPWHGGGDIDRSENEKLRAGISGASGGAVDGPVTMWRKDAGQMKAMCYSTIRWCHAHGKKFLYLLAPNESGRDFLKETMALAHDMENNDANPDIWAVSFYGPQSFRDKLETLPEKEADSRPAETFSGAAYWLIHHLRDPDHAAYLEAPKQRLLIGEPFPIVLANRSAWLDLAPVVRVRADGDLPSGWLIHWKLKGRDVTDAVMGPGLIFSREDLLPPGSRQELILEIECPDSSSVPQQRSLPLHIELLSHPSQPQVHQTLNLDLRF